MSNKGLSDTIARTKDAYGIWKLHSKYICNMAGKKRYFKYKIKFFGIAGLSHDNNLTFT